VLPTRAAQIAKAKKKLTLSASAFLSDISAQFRPDACG
jgi:hypothetical protein